MNFMKQDASKYPAIIFLMPNLFMAFVIMADKPDQTYFSKPLAWVFIGLLTITCYLVLSTVFNKWRQISKIQILLVVLEIITLLALVAYYLSLNGFFY